jgi:hypothetical protein
MKSALLSWPLALGTVFLAGLFDSTMFRDNFREGTPKLNTVLMFVACTAVWVVFVNYGTRNRWDYTKPLMDVLTILALPATYMGGTSLHYLLFG